MDHQLRPVVAVASTAAGIVPEVLMTTTSPGSRNDGQQVKVEWSMRRRRRDDATIMRTASRVSPRASGGSDASRSDGRS